MENKLPKIIVVVGPTASGKTDLAIKIAKRFNGEIVSADSRQIYKGMDIGTAKPPISPARKNRAAAKSSVPTKGGTTTPVYVDGIPHYLINIKNPDENYTVAEYKKNAIAATNKIIKKGKIPLLVGGTGLYVKAVTENLEIPEVKPDHKLRSRLERKIEKEGLEKVFEELLEIDPEAAYIVDGKNPRRVVRALEVTILTNKPFSAQRKKGKNLFETFKIGIELSPATLKKRIYKRADKMVKKGLVGEVKKLVKKYGERQIAFDAIGYKEIINYLNGKISLKEARELMNKNTLNFAKRQMTWFKKDKEIKWVEKESETFPLVKNFLLADKKQ